MKKITEIFKKPNNKKLVEVAWMTCVVIVISLMTIPRIFGEFNYLIDLFSHFQFQYFIGLLILLLIGVSISRPTKHLLVILIITILHFFVFLFPLTFLPIDLTDKEVPNLFYMNTNYYNQDTEPIINLIEESNSPIIALVEVNEKLIVELTPLYGDPIDKQGTGGNSCAIFTNSEAKALKFQDQEFEYPVCGVKIDNIEYILIHPTPPLSNSFFIRQKNFFNQIDNYLSQLPADQKYVLMGDFNSTSYNSTFNRHFKKIHKDNIYTWQSGELNSIPIDHIMSNFDIEVGRTKKVSSDHTGLYGWY